MNIAIHLSVDSYKQTVFWRTSTIYGDPVQGAYGRQPVRQAINKIFVAPDKDMPKFTSSTQDSFHSQAV